MDILRLAAAFQNEPSFKFNETEMTYFQRIYDALEPKAKAAKHMEAAMYYMRNHINEASSSMKPKPRDFEFNFLADFLMSLN